MASDHCRKCSSKLVDCAKCKGKGTVYQSGILTHSEKTCTVCNGTGQLCPKHGNDYG
jgi:DnaJ-class molecular chaperone